MSKKIRGSEKMMFDCDKNGKRSLADFENVEEALQANGGWCGTPYPGSGPIVTPLVKFEWFPRGIPSIDFKQNINVLTQGQF